MQVKTSTSLQTSLAEHHLCNLPPVDLCPREQWLPSLHISFSLACFSFCAFCLHWVVLSGVVSLSYILVMMQMFVWSWRCVGDESESFLPLNATYGVGDASAMRLQCVGVASPVGRSCGVGFAWHRLCMASVACA